MRAAVAPIKERGCSGSNAPSVPLAESGQSSADRAHRTGSPVVRRRCPYRRCLLRHWTQQPWRGLPRVGFSGVDGVGVHPTQDRLALVAALDALASVVTDVAVGSRVAPDVADSGDVRGPPTPHPPALDLILHVPPGRSPRSFLRPPPSTARAGDHPALTSYDRHVLAPSSAFDSTDFRPTDGFVADGDTRTSDSSA